MPSRPILSEDLLQRCAERATGYDRENRFFFEDFEELRQANYLLAAVPKEFGGLGLTLAEICQEQRRLARRSAPTALGLNMHLTATGIAADLWHKGDSSQDGCWRKRRGARYSPTLIRRAATTSRSSIRRRKPNVSTAVTVSSGIGISAR